ncbi:cytochrome d ubiquinol oxidase subunit II [Acidicapsa ligni]|uniref:cytochrome d ubiquinol oxidase subunit II n=1 Tax=Acidicapsa ligni TaxID=542300 RepID=UPI0021E0F608|nr:cytochrome d ubiquinol oxidase subunit II [Acidicapsa ligni]
MNIASVLACIMAAALLLYVLLAGADYGAGFWDLLSSGPSKDAQKELIANAIQPIWEANHVWLILILVLLFAGFPPAFGAVMIALHVPILLMLVGIVLRGSSFVFRAYSTIDSEMRKACAYVFSISSSFTPFFMGILIGSLSDNRVLVSEDVSINGYLFNWLNPFSVSMGLLTVALFAFLAASYLTAEAATDELRRTFRNRTVGAGVAGIVLTVITFALSAEYATGLREGFTRNSVAICFAIIAWLAIAVSFVALYKGCFQLSRIMAAVHAGSIVVVWAVAQYPYIARPQRTIFNSMLSATVVHDIVLACVAGAIVLFPSLGILLYVFKDQRRNKAAASSSKVQP